MNIYGICCFFNYTGYKKKLFNYKIFRNFIKQQGLKLITVELGFDGKFEISPEDTDILVQVFSGDCLWQKERLLNIGMGHLPEDCEAVVLLDTDVIFLNDNWVAELQTALEQYKIVQPFKNVFRRNIPRRSNSAFLSMTCDRLQELHSDYTQHNLSHDAGILGIVKMVENGKNPMHAHSGYAWAFRRGTIGSVSLFENAVLGSGDRIMATCFLGLDRTFMSNKYTPGLLTSIDQYVELVNTVASPSEVGHLNSTNIIALNHGDYADRRYEDRYELLKQYSFDPALHLVKTPGAGLLLSDTFPVEGRTEIIAYFNNRKEDIED